MDTWVGSMIGGIVGAVIGHAANHCIGWFKETKQSSPERKFICAELVFILECDAVKCAEVVQDERPTPSIRYNRASAVVNRPMILIT